MDQTVKVSDIRAGEVAGSDYYSEKGELLVGKGTAITEKHLETFRRRNIFDVYVRSAGTKEEDEIRALLAKEFAELGDLDVDLQEGERRPSGNVVEGLKIDDVRTVKPGKEGLGQLLRSQLSLDLDTNISKNRVSDRPVGAALKERATQMTPGERTADYKKSVSAAYEQALHETKNLLGLLASGNRSGGKPVRALVERFVRIFVNDGNILMSLAGIKSSDVDYIYHHALNVCLLSINIAASMGYGESQVVEIGMGALLHDVGMLLIPEGLRTKEGRLRDEEWYEVQKHPIVGLHLLEKGTGLSEPILYVAYQTHERENGAGYPKQRGSHLIHRFAKIVQVADVYEAMTSPRSYRKPWLPHEATGGLIKMTRTELLNGEFVKAFLEYASLFPVGSLVELSDHRLARVVHANRGSYAKPIVSVLADGNGKPLDQSSICQVDLSTERDVQIVKAFRADDRKGLQLLDGF
jgi:HD-GYP domain-containing protein (c-di-GMP phosphodiesterase class II)